MNFDLEIIKAIFDKVAEVHKENEEQIFIRAFAVVSIANGEDWLDIDIDTNHILCYSSSEEIDYDTIKNCVDFDRVQEVLNTHNHNDIELVFEIVNYDAEEDEVENYEGMVGRYLS